MCTERCLQFPLATSGKLDCYLFVCPTCHNDYYHNAEYTKPYFVCSLFCSLIHSKHLLFFQGFYKMLEGGNLAWSEPAFWKEPVTITRPFILIFVSKVSKYYNFFVFILYMTCKCMIQSSLSCISFIMTSTWLAVPLKQFMIIFTGFFKHPNALLYKKIIFNLCNDQEKYFQVSLWRCCKNNK